MATDERFDQPVYRDLDPIRVETTMPGYSQWDGLCGEIDQVTGRVGAIWNYWVLLFGEKPDADGLSARYVELPEIALVPNGELFRPERHPDARPARFRVGQQVIVTTTYTGKGDLVGKSGTIVARSQDAPQSWSYGVFIDETQRLWDIKEDALDISAQ